MARTIRGGSLERRAARLKLAPRSRPYWIASARAGLHLGYRRLPNQNGTWIARTYQGRSGCYQHRAFAQADDYIESDGDEVLSYYEAVQRIAGAAPPVDTPAPTTSRMRLRRTSNTSRTTASLWSMPARG